MNKVKKALKWIGVAVAVPIVLFLLLAVLLYIPPVQNFAVHRVADRLSASMGMDIRVERVRLAFPLDLALHRVTAIDRGDTLLATKALRLHVRLLPLFEGRADVDGLDLYGVVADTKSYLPDVRIKGRIGALEAASHGIDWRRELVRLDYARLRDADVSVMLSDTAAKDTTKSQAHWLIDVASARIERSRVRLTLPGDSMRLMANIGRADLRKGRFDTGANDYRVSRFSLKETALGYDIPYLPHRREGLDPNHLRLEGVSLLVDTLSYDRHGRLALDLRGLTLHEVRGGGLPARAGNGGWRMTAGQLSRATAQAAGATRTRGGGEADKVLAATGLTIKGLSGRVVMDSVRLLLPDLRLAMPASRAKVSATLDLATLSTGRGGHLSADVDASIGRSDLRVLAAGYAPADLLARLPDAPLTLRARVRGNIDHLRLERLEGGLSGIVRLTASGYVRHALRRDRSGAAAFEIKGQRLTALAPLLPASVRRSVNLPATARLTGKATFSGNTYGGRLTLATLGGRLTAEGTADLRRETYRVKAVSRVLPVGRLVRGLKAGAFSGSVEAGGAGFNPLTPRARLTARARVDRFSYDRYDLSGLSARARLGGGRVEAEFASANRLLSATGRLNGRIGARHYELDLTADIPEADLHGLGLAKDTIVYGTQLRLTGRTDKHFTTFHATGGVHNNRFTTPRMSAMAKDIDFDITAGRDTTHAYVTAGDLRLDFGTKGELSRLTRQLASLGRELSREAADKHLRHERLKRFLPVASLYLRAGRDNPLYNILRMKGYAFDSVYVNLGTDPRRGATGEAHIASFRTGEMQLDTIRARILQDTTGINLLAHVGNSRRNDTPLSVNLRAYLKAASAGIELVYLDGQGRKGVDLGLEAALAEGGIRMHLYPERPVLAYRTFKVNADNFLFLGRDKRIRADIDLLADDGTGLKLYGEPKDSLNDLTVSLNHVNLGELTAVMPYLPKMGGMLGGDIHVTDNAAHTSVSAMASLQADNFSYEGTPLGQIGIDAIYLPKEGGTHHASAFISSAGEEVLACNGIYYSAGSQAGQFEGDARLHDFPLQLLNGFMTGTDVALKGKAGGVVMVKGTADKPVLNGSLDLDSAHIYSDVYGFDFRTDERALDIKDSRLVFDDYNLYSTGKNPLVLNGTFDMSDFSRMRMDFVMRANDFELINTRKKAQSMVYGKVYANYIGTLKGTPDDLAIRGKLEVLDRTDMTYILKDSPLSVDDRLSDLVEFVSFRDTLQRKEVKPAPSGSFDMTLGISISDAAQFHCTLSDDGQSYVNLEGGGDLTLRMTQQGDMRLTGRFTTQSGQMKYALPVIPLKTFNLVQGSYVEFTGDVMNPTLNIQAKERTRALVSDGDKQRSVAFDVGVSLTRPLKNMGLEFTIEAPEDLTIQNELATMTDAQRNKAAVALMATGMYMTDENMLSGGSGFKASNALNAFLQSEIQQIAGSAFKTIDINVGVESGSTETGAQTTDYSFQFAKRFWGNRISVIIGGKVSTGAEAQNTAESFISNVAVEYRLDQSATRYVKVFYDRNTLDPLEGQLTRTGASLVLRRKTDRLGELFIFRKKKPKQ